MLKYLIIISLCILAIYLGLWWIVACAVVLYGLYRLWLAQTRPRIDPRKEKLAKSYLKYKYGDDFGDMLYKMLKK